MFWGKLFVFFYFVVASLGSAYAFCTLWTAAPKESPMASAGAPPECKDGAGNPPQIVRLEPETVAIGENYLGIAIIGCNFSDHAKVRFNGAERTSNTAGSNQLNVPLFASDFAGAANIAVGVEIESPPKEGKTEPPAVLRSNVKNLRIKPPADVRVDWAFAGRTREITAELRLILLVLFVGGFSASVFGLNSFANYSGQELLKANWLWLYFARPIIGAGVAFVFYLIVRGGFLAGTNVDVKAVTPFGFVAVAALVGMFSDAAINKLNDIFDTMFRAKDTRKETLDALVIDSTGDLTGTVNTPYKYRFKARGGTVPYKWTAATVLPAWLHLTSEGDLEGNPTATSTASFTVQVTDAQGTVAKKECRLQIK